MKNKILFKKKKYGVKYESRPATLRESASLIKPSSVKRQSYFELQSDVGDTLYFLRAKGSGAGLGRMADAGSREIALQKCLQASGSSFPLQEGPVRQGA